ncbi:MAG: hypothetical protein Q4F13_02685 [Pseudomonadota bacterium]|nr:hypothetical protein [Pseudomonadota bacterium]
MANEWLRLWHDMPNDPKWRTIARVSKQPLSLVQAVYIHLMVDASRNVTRGVTTVTAEDLASALDCDDEAIEAILEAMQGRVLDGTALSGWERRQPKREDLGNPETGAMSAAERKRAQREREKKRQQELQEQEQDRHQEKQPERLLEAPQEGLFQGEKYLCHARSRDVTTDKDKDKDKEDIPPLIPPAGGQAKRKTVRMRCRLPEDFSPNECGQEMARQARIDVSAELQRFCDYHTAKGSLMADWQAAWRTWVGNAQRFGAAGKPAGRSAGPAVGSDEYFELHRNAAWWRDAGFDSVWEASNVQCYHHNAHEFRDGKRVARAA